MVEMYMNNSMIKKITPYFSAFCLIWLHNSYYMQANVSGIYRTMLPTILAVGVVLIQRNFKIDKKPLLFFTIIFALSILSDGLTQSFENIITIFIIYFGAMMLCKLCEFDKFAQAFNRCIYWICLISVMFYFINLYIPRALNLIPNFLYVNTWRGDVDSVYGKLYLYTFFVKQVTNYYRNFGIFVEPGMFQIYINLAILFEMFYLKNFSIKRLVVYLIAMATCLSTTGLVVTGILLSCYLLDKDTYISSRKRKAGYLIILIVVVTITFSPLIGVDILDNLSKMSQLKDEISYGTVSSGAERTRAYAVAIQAFLERPFLGWGSHTSEYALAVAGKHVIMTATCMNWFASGGIIVGTLWNYAYFGIIRYFNKNMIINIILMFSLFLMVSSQSMNGNLLIITLCFWGVSYKNRSNSDEESYCWN